MLSASLENLFCRVQTQCPFNAIFNVCWRCFFLLYDRQLEAHLKANRVIVILLLLLYFRFMLSNIRLTLTFDKFEPLHENIAGISFKVISEKNANSWNLRSWVASNLINPQFPIKPDNFMSWEKFLSQEITKFCPIFTFLSCFNISFKYHKNIK